MTRKDYNLIAEVLKNTKATAETCREMASELHKASKYTPNGNKSFDDDRFLKACGIEN